MAARSGRRTLNIGHGREQFAEEAVVLEHLEIQDLKVLLTVAETGSFRKSGLRLGLGQSAVSRRIRKLEDALGVSLFERRGSGARLTVAGWCFVGRARSLLGDFEAAVEAARSAGVGSAGQLQIGLTVSLSRGVLREVVRTFIADRPDIEIEIVEAQRSELMTLLSHRVLDVAIVSGEPSGESRDVLLLDSEPIYLSVPAGSALAGSTRLKWGDVSDALFLVSAREPGPEIHDYIIRRVSALGRSANVRRYRLGREGIMNLVGLGMGVSFVADHWTGVSYPGVVFVPIGDADERVPFSMTWRPENDNPALRRFVSLARVAAKNARASSAPSRSPDPSP